MIERFHHRPLGLGLIGLLTILVLIGLLSGIALLMYGGQAAQSRLDQARSDVEALAQAEMAVAKAHGVLVPLQMLDDMSVAKNEHARRTDDSANESENIRVIEAAKPCAEQVGHQVSAASKLADWKGPFYQAKRVNVGGDNPAAPPLFEELPPATVRHDYPLDPWGHPYRLYSPCGLVGTLSAKSDPQSLQNDAFSDGVLTNEEKRFDSFAVVSFGPDGKSDFASNGDDDVIYLFTVKK